MSEWHADLKPLPLKDVVKDPAHVAICSVDMLNGSCYEGNLASPRAAACVEPIVNLLKQAYSLGVRNYVLIQEWHSEQAEEFKAYGQHCVRGSREAQTVPRSHHFPLQGTLSLLTRTHSIRSWIPRWSNGSGSMLRSTLSS